MEQITNPITNPFSMETITGLTVRLAQLLATENSHLKKMEVGEIAKLQKEKTRLLSALEKIKKEIVRNPTIKNSFSKDELAEYQSISELFSEIAKENHINLKVARDVNSYVIKAVKDVLTSEVMPPQYTGKGSGTHSGSDMALSMTLNDVV